MCKERIFHREVKVNNFKLIPADMMADAGKTEFGDSLVEEAVVIAEVFYTPKGYRGEIHEDSPIRVWDEGLSKRLHGVSKDRPDGDLAEKNFDTALAAMHFLTRRLRKLGWEPLEAWHDS